MRATKLQKLRLVTETLRTLTPVSLRRARGGDTGGPTVLVTETDPVTLTPTASEDTTRADPSLQKYGCH